MAMAIAMARTPLHVQLSLSLHSTRSEFAVCFRTITHAHRTSTMQVAWSRFDMTQCSRHVPLCYGIARCDCSIARRQHSDIKWSRLEEPTAGNLYDSNWIWPTHHPLPQHARANGGAGQALADRPLRLCKSPDDRVE